MQSVHPPCHPLLGFYQSEVIRLSGLIYPEPALSQQIIRSKQFIDRHFARKIRLSDMAGAAFLSPYHFLRLFKRHYGKTPGRYLTEIRMQQARLLLASGAGVAEVAAAVGFDSVTSFCGLFRKFTGLTPSAYRLAKQKSNNGE